MASIELVIFWLSSNIVLSGALFVLSYVLRAMSKLDKRLAPLSAGYFLLATSLLFEAFWLSSVAYLSLSGAFQQPVLVLPKYRGLWVLELVLAVVGYGLMASYSRALVFASLPVFLGAVPPVLSSVHVRRGGSPLGKFANIGLALSFFTVALFITYGGDYLIYVTLFLRISSLGVVLWAISRARK